MHVVLREHRVVVVDKPSGTTSEEVALELGKKLVHRIDRGTSGLLVLADDARTVTRMQRALRAGAVSRTYLFVAHGAVRGARLEDVLVYHGGEGRRGVARAQRQALLGKRAITEVAPLLTSVHATVGLARLVTGRTHQVRIQLAHAGHPLVGDTVYGRTRGASECRLLLHALRLGFEHPNTHVRHAARASVPDDFVEAAARALAGGFAGMAAAELRRPPAGAPADGFVSG